MTKLNNAIYDNGLQHATDNVTRFMICSQEPNSYVEATATYALGAKDAPVLSGPFGDQPSGRKVAMSSFSDGAATANGTITHYALVDDTNSVLICTNTVVAPKAINNGDPFSSGTVNITYTGPAHPTG